jgi:hypothetical protein
MLRKTALSLFGLIVLAVCLNPPQANAGVIVAVGPVFPRPARIYPGPVYVAPSPYVAYRPYPYIYAPAYAYRGPLLYPRYYRPGYWAGRRFEHREFVVRRPYWRR